MFHCHTLGDVWYTSNVSSVVVVFNLWLKVVHHCEVCSIDLKAGIDVIKILVFSLNPISFIYNYTLT